MSLCVFTGSTEADIWIQVTFIDIDTSFHVFRCHEAIVTQAPVLSRYVRTLTTITDIGVIFTFVNVGT